MRARYIPGMASWSGGAETSHPADYRLVRNTFVTVFWQAAILDDTVDWLLQNRYDLVSFDASSWMTPEDMYDDLAQRLNFPDYFGRNLEALNDCMGDVASCEYGWNPDSAGIVVVFKAFDTFTMVDRRTAQNVLNIFANQARSAILIGNRIICLVQSNDPELTFEPVGATPVMWNDTELLDSKRGL